MIKNYYGEKIGFEYAYLYHYQAFLIYPAILGILVTCNSIYWFVQTRDLKNAFDTRWNGCFGLLVPVWGAIFKASWERKQRTIQYLWSVQDISFSKKDERDEEFRYYEVFNQFTNSV